MTNLIVIDAPSAERVQLPQGRPIHPDSPTGFDPERARRLEAYAGRFADLFTRSDQFRGFRLYLRGLLDGDRKNAEAIAARVAPDEPGNVAQALQHFVSHSPWDPGRVFARYRELLPAAYRGGSGRWVVHDGTIPKKGRHSVGTQRQFARSLGSKVNCQVAVVVGRAGPGGYVPLSMRLYLPGFWLREHRAAAEKTVPPAMREHVGKPDIALGLIDELAGEGWAAATATGDESYTENADFRDRLDTRSVRLLAPGNGFLTTALTHFDTLKQNLGLDHFEGRTWLGWHHHAALVLAAYGFLLGEPV